MSFLRSSVGEAAKGTGEAAEIFRAMGIDVRDVNGEMKPLGELLDEVADAMAQQEDPAKKAFAAQRLFGRAGTALIPTLNQGADGMREQGEAARELGLITADEAARAEKYVDEMTRLKDSVKGVGNAIGADLIPHLTPAVEGMRAWMVENRFEIVERLKTAVSDLAGMFSWIAGRIRDAVATLKGWHEWLGANVPLYDETIGKLADLAGELGWLRGAVILLAVWLGKGLLMAIIGLFRPLVLLGWAVLRAAGMMLWLAATAVFAVAKALWGLGAERDPCWRQGLCVARSVAVGEPVDPDRPCHRRRRLRDLLLLERHRAVVRAPVGGGGRGLRRRGGWSESRVVSFDGLARASP